MERIGALRRFLLERKADGVVFGVYPGDTPEEALEALHADTAAKMDGCSIRGLDLSAWIVKEVGIAHE